MYHSIVADRVVILREVSWGLMLSLLCLLCRCSFLGHAFRQSLKLHSDVHRKVHRHYRYHPSSHRIVRISTTCSSTDLQELHDM
jgi:hypothetical protein